MKKKILIMGGTYFIGKKIVDVLIEQNYDLYILNRGTKEVTDIRITNLVSDRNILNNMKKALGDYHFDIIIDVSGVTPQQINILLTSINIDSLEHFIFISSSAVYDIDNLKAPFKETDTLKKNSYWTEYSQNKIDSEKLITSYFKEASTTVSILRPPFVYGENNYAPREAFVFEHILNNKPIIVPLDGNTKLQFIYTTDLANIISKLILSPPNTVNIFNVGNRKAVTMLQWIQYCEQVVNKKAIVVHFDYKKYKKKITSFFPFYDYDNVLDVSRIYDLYPFETDFIVGLSNAFKWYQENINSFKFNTKLLQSELEILELLRNK